MKKRGVRKVAVVMVGLLMWQAMPVSAADAGTPGVTALEESSYTVTGEFVSYSREDQEITVRDDNGEELIFTVDQDRLAPTINGQTASYDQLRAGDRLTLTVVDDENGEESVTAIAATRIPAAP